MANAICIDSKVVNSNVATKKAIAVTRTVGPKCAARRRAGRFIEKVYNLLAK
jgi:hypothetical protein